MQNEELLMTVAGVMARYGAVPPTGFAAPGGAR